MKKMPKKLGVSKETVRVLGAMQLREVAGGVNASGAIGTGAQYNSCVRGCPSNQTQGTHLAE